MAREARRETRRVIIEDRKFSKFDMGMGSKLSLPQERLEAMQILSGKRGWRDAEIPWALRR